MMRLADAAATHQVGRQLGEHLSAGMVLLLEGDLGAGKTSLVQGIGVGLGIWETIDSPTFTLINEYLEGRVPLYHLDLYRLEPAEVVGLHLDAYWDGLEVEPGIVAIEWAERLPYLPQDYLRVNLSHTADGARLLAIAAIGQIELPLLPGFEPFNNSGGEGIG